MSPVNAHLWAGHWWNSSPGRAVWWCRRHRQTGSFESRQAARWAYLVSVSDVGEAATQAALFRAGLPLPAGVVPLVPSAAALPVAA